MKLVLVEWVDSSSSNGWTDIAALKRDIGPVHCRSVGWLASEKGAEFLLLLPHTASAKPGDEPSQANGDISIPLCAVLKTTWLVDPTKKRKK